MGLPVQVNLLWPLQNFYAILYRFYPTVYLFYPIFHYFIYYTCEILKKYNKKYKPVIFFDSTNELNLSYSPFLDVFVKKFPVIVLQEDCTFGNFKKKLKCDGYREELHVVLMRKLKKNQSKSFYFNKLQYFCKKYDLTFLDKTYFEDMRNKLSLL